MNAYTGAALVLLFAMPSACGRQLVEFPTDGASPDAPGVDAAGNDAGDVDGGSGNVADDTSLAAGIYTSTTAIVPTGRHHPGRSENRPR